MSFFVKIVRKIICGFLIGVITLSHVSPVLAQEYQEASESAELIEEYESTASAKLKEASQSAGTQEASQSALIKDNESTPAVKEINIRSKDLLPGLDPDLSMPSASLSQKITKSEASLDPDYLYYYQFKGGVKVKFYDILSRRPSFAVVDESQTYQLRFSLREDRMESSGITFTSENTNFPTVKDNTIEFPVNLAGIEATLKYTINPGQIKEEFIIKNIPDANVLNKLPERFEIPFDISTTGLKHELIGSTHVFKKDDGSNDIVWALQAPTIEDAQKNTTEINLEVEPSASPKEAGLLVLSFDSSFLKTASYPVIIDPTININNSSILASGYYPPTMQRTVRTSEGTLHAFVNTGTLTTTCAGTPAGLTWIYSTDNGATWTCGAQFNSSIGLYAHATTDAADNIYVVYSTQNNGAGTSNDVFYRMLTKGAGSTWTVGAAQTAFDGTASVGYSYAVVEREAASNHLWLAARYFDGTNYQVSVYYSGDLSVAPTWTASQVSLNTAGNNSGLHYPAIVKFGSKIGVIYQSQYPSSVVRWKTRSDSDGLTSWSGENIVSTIGGGE